MADSYAEAAAVETFDTTAEEFEALAGALAVDPDNLQQHGFEISREEDGDTYFYSVDYASEGALPPEFLSALGKCLTRQGLNFLEVGVAFYCSKPRLGEFGGYYCRITAKGEIVYPKVVWEGEEDGRD